MRIQFTKEARKLYTDICSELSGRRKDLFKQKVEETFNTKITSEVDLPEFKIEVSDVIRVASHY